MQLIFPSHLLLKILYQGKITLVRTIVIAITTYVGPTHFHSDMSCLSLTIPYSSQRTCPLYYSILYSKYFVFLPAPMSMRENCDLLRFPRMPDVVNRKQPQIIMNIAHTGRNCYQQEKTGGFVDNFFSTFESIK